MDSILEDLTCDVIDVIYTQTKSEENIIKIKEIYKIVLGILFEHIQPYFYTLLTIIILMLVMNIVQFYYLIKLKA